MSHFEDVGIRVGPAAGNSVEIISKRAGDTKNGLDVQGGLKRKIELFNLGPVELFKLPDEIDYFDPMGFTLCVESNTGVTAGNEAQVGLAYSTGADPPASANLFPYTPLTGLLDVDTIRTFWLNEASKRLRARDRIWLYRAVAPTAGTSQIVNVELFGNVKG
jgi:hypothetical protein